MRIAILAAIVAAWTAADALAQAQVKPVIEGKREVLYLDDLANPKRWSPGEASVEASADLKADGRPTLHMHVDVDFYHGEPGYPIGWPRMYLELKRPAETSWTEYESFEFMLMAKMSRASAPNNTADFRVMFPNKLPEYARNFSNLKLGEWIHVSFPTCDIPNLKEIARLGFSMGEANYAHGDKLDFYLGDFRLTRSTEFTLRSLSVKTSVVYQGLGELRVEVDALGPKAKVARGLPMMIRQGDKVVRTETLPVVPGRQTLFVDIGELKLEPGNYTVVAFPDEPERKMSGDFRVVEAPWPAGEKK